MDQPFNILTAALIVRISINHEGEGFGICERICHIEYFPYKTTLPLTQWIEISQLQSLSFSDTWFDTHYLNVSSEWGLVYYLPNGFNENFQEIRRNEGPPIPQFPLNSSPGKSIESIKGLQTRVSACVEKNQDTGLERCSSRGIITLNLV